MFSILPHGLIEPTPVQRTDIGGFHGDEKRDPAVVERFLKKEGLTKIPKGKEVDHKVPLVDGGSDTVRNLQLLTEKQHADKTAREAGARAKKKGK